MNACPDADALLSLLEGELDAVEDARIVAHVEDCGGCQDRLEGLTRSQIWACEQSTLAPTIDERSPGARTTAFWGRTTDFASCGRSGPRGPSVLVMDETDHRPRPAAPGDWPAVGEPTPPISTAA